MANKPFDVRTSAPWDAPVPLPGLDTPYLKTDKTGTVVTKFLHGTFVDTVLFDKNSCLVTRINGTHAVWDGSKGIWLRGNKAINWITNHYHRDANKQNRAEVCNSVVMELEKQGINNFTDDNIIAFQNGYLNIAEYMDGKTDCLHPADPEAYAVNIMGYDWNPEADDGGVVEKYLETVSDNNPETIQNIKEAMGLALYSKSALKNQQTCILYGPGGNGKSVFIKFMTYCLGKENVSEVKMDQLDGHELETVADKLANFDTDASALLIDNKTAGIWRSVSSGDACTLNPKFENPYSISATQLTWFLNINEQLKMKSADASSNGVYRRLFYIPFQHVFRETDPDYDPDIVNKLCTPECAAVMYKLALEGLQAVMENGFKYTPSSFNSEAKGEFLEDNDTVASWIRENDIDANVFTHDEGVPEILKVENILSAQKWCDYQNRYNNKRMIPCISPYEHYKMWAEDEGRKTVTLRNFNKRVSDILDITASRNHKWSTWTSTTEHTVRYPYFIRNSMKATNNQQGGIVFRVEA